MPTGWPAPAVTQRDRASGVLAMHLRMSSHLSLGGGPLAAVSSLPRPRVNTYMPSARDLAAIASSKLREARLTLIQVAALLLVSLVTERGVAVITGNSCKAGRFVGLWALYHCGKAAGSRSLTIFVFWLHLPAAVVPCLLISHKPAGVPVVVPSPVTSAPGVVQSAGVLNLNTDEMVFGEPSEKNTITRKLERLASAMLFNWSRAFHTPSEEFVKPLKLYLPMAVFMAAWLKPRATVLIGVSTSAPYEKWISAMRSWEGLNWVRNNWALLITVGPTEDIEPEVSITNARSRSLRMVSAEALTVSILKPSTRIRVTGTVAVAAASTVTLPPSKVMVGLLKVGVAPR